MVDFPQTVAVPPTSAYGPGLTDFSAIANAPNTYYQGQFNQQQKQLNDAKIAQAKQQIELAKSFAGGLPTDANGQIDYRAAAGILASKGDIGGAVSLLQQQPAPLSPMFGGQGQGQGQPQGGPAGPAAPPQSVQAKPLPPPARNSPQGDSGENTLTSIVTDRLPAQNQTTGQTIMKIAEVMGIDPNAQMTPGQVRRAQGLLQKYAPDIAGVRVGQGGGSSLPPSMNGVTPAAVPGGGGSAAGATAGPGAAGTSGAPAPQPQQPQQQPLVPQEPLPPGFNDPMQAVKALRLNAAQLAGDPRRGAKEQASAMDAWADRIEASIKPVSVGSMSTLVDPRTGKPVFQGAGAAAIAGQGADNSTRDADAELYRQTGKLPPNMGRGVQGAAEAQRIRERAVEQEIAEGGDPSQWATRWQSFGAQAAGRRVLETRSETLKLAENEATTLIPRVRDISAKVSRTNYPTINALIEAADQGKGGTDVIKLGIAINSLIPVYARVLKPVGQITEGDTHRATDILNKAWSDGQINGALDQMEVELKSARSALEKTLDESRGGGKKSSAKSDSGSNDPSGPAKVMTKDDYDALPSGKHFTAPDGSVRVKP
jgi:hypothetical protein